MRNATTNSATERAPDGDMWPPSGAEHGPAVYDAARLTFAEPERDPGGRSTPRGTDAAVLDCRIVRQRLAGSPRARSGSTMRSTTAQRIVRLTDFIQSSHSARRT